MAELDVSVVIATYNGERWIEQQLRSLIEQTRRPAEIVVCDDGSSDSTVAAVQRFAETSPVPIRVVQNDERLGWRGNFMRAASFADADLVAFCDQDDVWRPGKLETCVASFSASTLLVFHGAALIDGSGAPVGRLIREPQRAGRFAPMEAQYWRNPLGFTMVFRRELLGFSDFWPRSVDQTDAGERAAHDQWIWFLATTYGEVFYLADELVDYRLHGGNAMGHRRGRMSLRDVHGAGRDALGKCGDKVMALTNRRELLRSMRPADPDWDELRRRAIDRYTDSIAFNRARMRMLKMWGIPARLVGFLALLVRYSYVSPALPEGNQERIRDALAVVAGVRKTS